MLILSRKPGQSIVIDGRIVIKILRLDGDLVKIGIEAPREVPVHRLEVYEEIQANNKGALTELRSPLPPELTRAGAVEEAATVGVDPRHEGIAS